MSNSVKFMFDTPFEGVSSEAFEATARARAPRYSEEDLERGREMALAEGMSAGLEQARLSAEAAIAKSLEQIQQGLKGLEVADHARRKEAATLALAIGRKLATALLEREPLAEIEALVRDCLSEVVDEPRVVTRIDEALLEDLKRRLGPIVAESGFAGEVVVLGDDAFSGSDCRVEWADGGAERRLAAVEHDVAAVIERYLGECESSATEPCAPLGAGLSGPTEELISNQAAGDDDG
jgi:flagellar assembly protein FliH